MDSTIEAFLDQLILKLIRIDWNIGLDFKDVETKFTSNKAFHGGSYITIKFKVLLIKPETVNWMIQQLEENNFNYDLFISRFLLDPKRNEIDEIPSDWRFVSNTEFYLTINKSDHQLKGRCVFQWDKYGFHISNDNYYFNEYQKGTTVLRMQPTTIYPAQNN